MAWIAASLVLAAAAILTVASPASAHADLASTDPAAGAALAALPAEITLTFTEAPLTRTGLTVVHVTDAAGRSLTAGDPRVEGVDVTQRLAGRAAGPIDVSYRVVTSDGHPTTGEYTFTVAGTAPTATATPTPTYTPPAVVEQGVVPTWDPTPQAAASGFTDVAPLLLLLTGLFAALVGAVVVLLRALRRPPRSEADSDR
jgi:methionine-rich copper-binding protein CopC